EGSSVASLDTVHAVENSRGVVANNGAKVTVSDSVLANNSDGFVVGAFSGTFSDGLITRSTVSGGLRGVSAKSIVGSNIARLVVDTTTINEASTAFYLDAGGATATIYSPNNNTVGFNDNIVAGGAI